MFYCGSGLTEYQIFTNNHSQCIDNNDIIAISNTKFEKIIRAVNFILNIVYCLFCLFYGKRLTLEIRL